MTRARPGILKVLYERRHLLALLLPGLAYYLVFRYGPMYGMVIAFKRFDFASGIIGSPWVGLKYFEQFVGGPYFYRLVRNTMVLSLYQLVFGFPAPIILALLINEVRGVVFKRAVQTITYLPHFISVVIVVGLLKQILSPTSGVVNHVLLLVGHPAVNFFMDKGWFRPMYVGSEIWQETGWNAILYLAALSNIDAQLYESAWMDGANRFRCTWHVTLPGLRPTIVIVLLLRLGRILNVGYEKVLLMYSPATYETADVISTFVYRSGIAQANYSFAAAIDFMNAGVILVLVWMSNAVARRLGETALW
jgi:putative aldouronate transport system permease protein